MSPTGPVGCHPLNFLKLINLSLKVALEEFFSMNISKFCLCNIRKIKMIFVMLMACHSRIVTFYNIGFHLPTTVLSKFGFLAVLGSPEVNICYYTGQI